MMDCDTDNELDYDNGDDATACRCCGAIIGVDKDGAVYEL